MALFQKSVLNQFLKDLDKTKVANAYSLFKSHFHNATIQQQIRDSKEEQYQEGFCRDLFVNILGYTLNPQPNFNLTTEQKNETDSKKADGAILKDGNVIAVIELKGTNTTDLNTVTPQAFGYKNNQKNCKYVIISNFSTLRLYIDNAIDFEEFNLFTLTEDEFTLLYLCLHCDNILSDLPNKIKQASTVKEENITKQLYKDYSDLKRKLFTDIVHLNPQYDKLILFKKSQKLLDRILFILFAEDRGLLQANTIQSILDDFDNLKKLDAYLPLYDRFKKHFTYLNEGFKNEKYDVYGYNGGLFAPDEILNSILISDNLLLNYTPALAKYDYETDVDVNILGHIFEHSLNDIEEIQAELETQSNGFKPIEKKITKRKKDGVFYTPKYITKYIVENTVGALCTEKRNEYGIIADNYTPDKRKAKKKELLHALDSYQNWLLEITIVDPACGSGAFLNQALDFLIQEHKSIDELRAQLLGHSLVLPDHEIEILENNIFGVDLNEESVEIARLSLWLRTARKGRKLNSLNNNIKCGNSLIDDKAIAGEKAFNWQNEFPRIFKLKQKEAFHVVLTTHNSRTSQRMIEKGVMKGDPLELNTEQEIYLTEIIRDIIAEKNYKCIAYNICKDHVHLILVCELNELNDIVKTIKGKSAYLFNKGNGLKPIGESIEKNESESNGFQPVENSEIHNGHLWSQKFFRANLDVWELNTVTNKPGYIYKDSYLQNAIEYIKNNRVKHNLPQSENLEKIIQSFCTDEDSAFTQEYSGGFDVVIGNPPYVKVQNLNHLEVDWYKINKVVAHKRIDISIMFFELSKKILKKDGRLSFITSNQFLVAEYGRKIREFILGKFKIQSIIDFGDLPIFDDALTYVSIFTFSNENPNNFRYKKINSIIGAKHTPYTDWIQIDINSLNSDGWILAESSNKEIINKLEDNKTLSEIGKCNYGIVSGNDEIFILSKIDIEQYRIEHGCLLPLVRSNNCYRYGYSDFDYQIIYPYHLIQNQTALIPLETLSKDYPNTYKYLLENKSTLEQRKDSRTTFENSNNWYSLTRFGQLDTFNQNEKIIFPGEQKHTKFGIDNNKAGYSGARVFSITITDTNILLRYLLSILNSKVIQFYIHSKFPLKQGGYYSMSSTFVDKIPIKQIPISDQQPFIEKAETMLQKNKELQTIKTNVVKLLQSRYSGININTKLSNWNELTFKDFCKELEKSKGFKPLGIQEQAELMQYFEAEQTKANTIQQTITQTDTEIDQMVYKLYELTEEEIKIIEQ